MDLSSLYYLGLMEIEDLSPCIFGQALAPGVKIGRLGFWGARDRTDQFGVM